jgi:type II secretory pathway pseudopilin PulG
MLRSVRSKRSDGYLLLETSIALAIVGLALFLTVSTVWRYRLATERVAAHREGLRALEQAHETLRAGAAPLRAGRLDLEPRGSARFRPQVFVEIQHLPQRGLERITLVCRYSLQGSMHQSSLETLFWRP